MRATWLDGEEFDAYMQAYRHAPIMDQAVVVAQFEAVKRYIRRMVEPLPLPEVPEGFGGMCPKVPGGKSPHQFVASFGAAYGVKVSHRCEACGMLVAWPKQPETQEVKHGESVP